MAYETDRMPFGKYKGRLLRELPDQYLEWLSALNDLRPPLRQRIVDEQRRRKFEGQWTTPPVAKSAVNPEPTLTAKIVEKGYRTLAKQIHPDHGGDNRMMQRLNDAVEWLRRRL
jgi:hypothetical protein